MTTNVFNLTDPSLAVPLASGRDDRSTVLAWIDVLYSMLYDVDAVVRDGATLFIRSIALDVGYVLPDSAGRLFFPAKASALVIAKAEMPAALERMGLRHAVVHAETVIRDIASAFRTVPSENSSAA